jgi:act minimal PKS acyl carrier protein
MAEFTIDDLRRIMRACAGEDEAVDLDGDILDICLKDLGYDSLAIMEIAARLQQELDVSIPDEVVESIRTPRDAVEYVAAASQGATNIPRAGLPGAAWQAVE